MDTDINDVPDDEWNDTVKDLQETRALFCELLRLADEFGKVLEGIEQQNKTISQLFRPREPEPEKDEPPAERITTRNRLLAYEQKHWWKIRKGDFENVSI